jgi:hypothetical protein
MVVSVLLLLVAQQHTTFLPIWLMSREERHPDLIAKNLLTQVIVVITYFVDFAW